nr:hypothetical protein [Tanacetum cinerariifolium]
MEDPACIKLFGKKIMPSNKKEKARALERLRMLSTPFEALCGQPPPVHIHYVGGWSKLNTDGFLDETQVKVLDRKMVKRNNAMAVYGLVQ